YAGTQHGSATWPLTDSNPLDGSRAQCPMNTVDYRPLLRAALVRLDRWVSAEEPPPPSRCPRLSDGTAVLPESTADVFSGIPGMGFPAHLRGPPAMISDRRPTEASSRHCRRYRASPTHALSRRSTEPAMMWHASCCRI